MQDPNLVITEPADVLAFSIATMQGHPQTLTPKSHMIYLKFLQLLMISDIFSSIRWHFPQWSCITPWVLKAAEPISYKQIWCQAWSLHKDVPVISMPLKAHKNQIHIGLSTCKIISILLVTHWGQVTHICASKITIISSDNGLSPGWHQAIICINVGMFLIGLLGISIKMHIFSFNKMHYKMSPVQWPPFCLGLNVLSQKN